MTDFRYFIWMLLFSAVWLVFIFLRRDLLKQSFSIGAIVAIFTPFIGWWHMQDYWNPVFAFSFSVGGVVVGAEEVLLGFFLGAISSIAYEVLARKTPVPQRKPFSVVFPFLLLGIIYMIAAGLVLFAGMNSIYASFVVFGIAAVFLSFLRKDLIFSSIVSGIAFACILFLSYVLWLEFLFPGTIKSWWLLSNLSGFMVWGVPAEEIVWGFLWGLVASILYKTWRGLGFQKKT